MEYVTTPPRSRDNDAQVSVPVLILCRVDSLIIFEFMFSSEDESTQPVCFGRSKDLMPEYYKRVQPSSRVRSFLHRDDRPLNHLHLLSPKLSTTGTSNPVSSFSSTILFETIFSFSRKSHHHTYPGYSPKIFFRHTVAHPHLHSSFPDN